MQFQNHKKNHAMKQFYDITSRQSFSFFSNSYKQA